MTEEIATIRRQTPDARRLTVRSNVQRKDYGNSLAPCGAQITSGLLKHNYLNVYAIHLSTQQYESKFHFNSRQIKFPSFVVFYLLSPSILKYFAPLFNCTLNSRINSRPHDFFIFYKNKIPSVQFREKIIAALHDIGSCIPHKNVNALIRAYTRLLREESGLPVIEVQASGVQVVCSNAASLLKVAENSALLFNMKGSSMHE